MFKYECLSDFYFRCARLGHSDKNYDHEMSNVCNDYPYSTAMIGEQVYLPQITPASCSNHSSSWWGNRWNSPSPRYSRSSLGSWNPSTKTASEKCLGHCHLYQNAQRVFEGRLSLSLSLSLTEPQVSPTLPMLCMATYVETSSNLSLNLSTIDLFQKKFPTSTDASTASWLTESS